jgi:hypothetical protein
MPIGKARSNYAYKWADGPDYIMDRDDDDQHCPELYDYILSNSQTDYFAGTSGTSGILENEPHNPAEENGQ